MQRPSLPDEILCVPRVCPHPQRGGREIIRVTLALLLALARPE
jgi:hypothetical protein